MVNRRGYLLTTDASLPRIISSKGVLERVGFDVTTFKAIAGESSIHSNKNSLMRIIEAIRDGEDEWGYVFEDDIDILEPITLDEIAQYEAISAPFFFLGMCKVGYYGTVKPTRHSINGHLVCKVAGHVRGAHAFAFSRAGAAEFMHFAREFKDDPYFDRILDRFSFIHPASIVRFDLESYLDDHRGIFFQDRKRWEPVIKEEL
jgi:hypothetical protein